MADFDAFIAEALASKPGEPDRLFVAGVQARILLDQRLAAERRALLSRLALEIAGIAAVAASLLVLGGSPAVREFAARSPVIAAVGVIAAFICVVALFSSSTPRPRSATSKLNHT